jgi:hypothetical protein
MKQIGNNKQFKKEFKLNWTKLRGLSAGPLVNYTDQVTAACGRN